MSSSDGSSRAISSKLLRGLSAKKKDIFTLSDAQEITKTSAATTRVLLSDLVKRKSLIRLAPGKYLIVPLSAGENAEYSENWYIIAKHLIEPNPYYLSHYSALDLHEMTTQPLITVFITTPTRRKIRKAMGATFRFVYTNPSKIWGFEDIWVKPDEKVKVSDLERTIVDCLDNPKLCGGIAELAKGLWKKKKEIDYARLVDYIERFGSKAVAKRLGFLLDLYGIDNNISDIIRSRFLTPTFILLDPSLPARGKHMSGWRVRVNLEPEELREITKT